MACKTGDEACSASSGEELGTTSGNALSCNASTIDKVVNNPKGSAPIISRTGEELLALSELKTSGVIVFQTFALLDAYAPVNSVEEKGSFKVTNDPDTSKNGYYSWVSGTTYTKDASLVQNVIEESNTSDAVSGSAVYRHVKKEPSKVLPEQDLRNSLFNGNFKSGVDGLENYIPDMEMTKLVSGMKIAHQVYNKRTAETTISGLFNTGDRYVFYYDIDVANWIDGYSYFFTLGFDLAEGVPTSEFTYVDGVTNYKGAYEFTIKSGVVNATEMVMTFGCNYTQFTSNIIHYMMVVPFDGIHADKTLPQLQAEIDERGLTDTYFEFGNYAEYAIRSKEADNYPDGYTSFEKIDPNLTVNRFENVIFGGDFTVVTDGWATPAAGSFVAGEGLVINDSVTGTINKTYTTSGNTPDTYVKVKKDHRYVFYVDIEVKSAEAAYFSLEAFLINPAIAISAFKQLPTNKRHLVAMPVDVTVDDYEETSNIQPYVRTSGWKSLDFQNLYDYDLDIVIKSFMMVDLGVVGDEYYDTDFDHLGDVFNNMDNYWFGLPDLEFKHTNHATKSTYAKTSETATVATRAMDADKSDILYTSWEGKKVGSYGDSLVMQAAWQSYVSDAMGFPEMSRTGLSGGQIGGVGGGHTKENIAELPSDMDALIILSGANDVPNETAYLLGEATDPALTDSELLLGTLPSTFCQAYNTMLLNIYKLYPKLNIFLCTQQQYFGSYWGNGMQNTPWSEEKVIKIREIANLWGYPLIDLWSESGINFWTKSLYLHTEDSGQLLVHHNPAGGKKVAKTVVGSLRKHQPIAFEPSDYGPIETFD